MNTPLWWGMLIMRDACVEAGAIFLPQLFCKSKTALKQSLKKKKKSKWGKIHHTNTHQKKAGVAILLSGTVDFKKRKILRDKDK